MEKFPVAGTMEKNFFFKCSGSDLFGILHVPDANDPNRNTGIVFCAPFAEEKLWAHRVFVNFARLLAKSGYSVLRFDYRGHGDSDGWFEDATLLTRLEDIQGAVSVLRKEALVDRVGLLGLRLGASLAFIAAEDAGVDFLLLWEPILDGEDYFQQCLRSNLATQMALYRKIRKTREQLIDELKNGKLVNIDGYLISNEFYQQLIQVDIADYENFPAVPIFTCRIAKSDHFPMISAIELFQTKCEQSHAQSVFLNIREIPFWKEQRVYFQNSDLLFEESMQWLHFICG